ncbi:Sps19p [Sugiyamaella lignohabitans]|uniref:Sps19p n=1 Tax=Sugiyamaella lignohabitans TaxID=796027 RepID=A0A161HHP4_9ASCO|nr:Sps19p [Sugiyamaella lignohabitans]ANB15600.1 Sps19p [Sugiyamaella lignohabitans]
MSKITSPLFSLEGKVALVTGGSRGLGLYISEGFLAAGASKVYISSRKAKACEEAVAELNRYAESNGLKGRAYSIPADLGIRKGVEHLAAEFAKLESKLDILVANAGASWGADFEKHPDSAIGKVLDLNLRGVFSSIQLFAPFLEKAGSSTDPARVLITGSVAGISSGLSGGTYGYLASKAAVHHLGKSLAVELGPRNITVNVLAPGFFPTKMANGLLEVIGDEITQANPRGRLGTKEDIIAASLFLASPGGNYINGVVLPIDGGSHLSKL